MIKHLALFAAALLISPGPSLAAASSFSIVNKTGSAISSLQIRRSGTTAWQPIGGAPANGARASISFRDPDCAFDIQARTADGKTLTYSGVNLCDVGIVTLNRSSNGGVWVDYD